MFTIPKEKEADEEGKDECAKHHNNDNDGRTLLSSFVIRAIWIVFLSVCESIRLVRKNTLVM